MKKITLLFLLGLTYNLSIAQQEPTFPEFSLSVEELKASLYFLSSDELKGRRTGSEGNNIAARYIASRFEAYGLEKAPGAEGYYQVIPFEGVKPPAAASLTIGDLNYEQGSSLLIMRGPAVDMEAKVVFAGHGWKDAEKGYDDYKKVDVKDKIVVVLPGTPDASDPLSVFQAMKKKRQYAAEEGAVALVEMFRLQFPWDFFLRYFNKENLTIADSKADNASNLVYGWLKETKTTELKPLMDGKKFKARLSSDGFSKRPNPSQNVIGIIPGTDPELKEEYVVLTAHYDHVGTGKDGGGAFTPQDSIFNGARDNGMGTTALLAATKSLALSPPKRSVIVLAVTGEEMGLLGSNYYVENPLIPLNKTIYNLNTDGAGYNTTEHVSIIGYGRTGVDDLYEKGSNAFGLQVIQDPAPEQNLFDRSDNVSFAAKGVPCVSLSPGVTDFDQELMKNYHQVTDEATSIDYEYLKKYCQSFVYTARLIADHSERPQWKAGDKYEEAGKALYK